MASTSSTARPLLLLDIDGVIRLFGPEPRDGAMDLSGTGLEDLIISAATPGNLATLGAHFELVWATSWEDEANESRAPVLDLPPLPVIEFRHEIAPGESLKLAPIAAYVGDRSFAWVDDDIGNDARSWAAERSAASFLLEVNPRRGLDADAMDELLDFARANAGGRSP